MFHNSSDRHSPAIPPQAPPPQTKSQDYSEGKSEAAHSRKGRFHRLTTPMDENADRLMEEVFGDIERLLERGAQLQLESPSVPEPPSQFSNKTELPDSGAITSQTAAAPPSLSSSLALLPKLSPRQLTKDQDQENTKAHSDEETDFILELASELKPQPEPHQSPNQWLMRIAFVSLVISSGLWVFVRYYLPKAPVIANVPSTAEVLQAKHDAEFLNYVQRSMERIERASKQAEASASSEPGSLPSALPPLYVPLPPPPAMSTTPAAVPSPTARISVAPLPPVATVPSAPASVSSAPAAAAVIPNIAPSPTHVLLGLLELGDRSAALFEIDDAPQRIQVGEAIGSSGWALVSVSGKEAIVRRNGEVRSVYIGQKF